jgi:hypothetical protein
VVDTSASDWAERWRALRGSPPTVPPDEAYHLLSSIPPDALTAVAEASGDDPALVQWWAEIAAHPARGDLAVLRLSQIPIYREVMKSGPLTDDELVDKLGIKKSSVSPRRKELVTSGLIRETERRVTSSGRTSAAWGVVPAEGIGDARRAAAEKGPRRKHLSAYPLEMRVAMARSLVRMDDVNALLVEDEKRSKASDRARRAARAVINDRDRARREYNERIRQAERDASPRLLFLKAVGQLRRATDAVREIDLVIGENIDSQLLFGSSDIPLEDWPEVRTELENLMMAASSADGQLTRLLGDPDVIDVEGYEVDEFELDEGES